MEATGSSSTTVRRLLSRRNTPGLTSDMTTNRVDPSCPQRVFSLGEQMLPRHLRPVPCASTHRTPYPMAVYSTTRSPLQSVLYPDGSIQMKDRETRWCIDVHVCPARKCVRCSSSFSFQSSLEPTSSRSSAQSATKPAELPITTTTVHTQSCRRYLICRDLFLNSASECEKALWRLPY